MKMLSLLLAGGIHVAAAGGFVVDEGTRREVLGIVFPAMKIELLKDHRIDKSKTVKLPKAVLVFPDALRGEPVYRVSGLPINRIELCASENVETERSSETRLVRFRLARLRQNGLHAAIVQYEFAGARPAFSCPSVPLLVSLKRVDGRWQETQRLVLDATHHWELHGIRTLDVTGDGVDELIVESGIGGAPGVVGTHMHVFDTSQGDLRELAAIASRFHAAEEEERTFVQVLDLDRSRRSRGGEICFEKRVYELSDKWLDAPKITRPCYPKGTLLSRTSDNERWLRPIEER